jgi:hypothetical protein
VAISSLITMATGSARPLPVAVAAPTCPVTGNALLNLPTTRVSPSVASWNLAAE